MTLKATVHLLPARSSVTCGLLSNESPHEGGGLRSECGSGVPKLFLYGLCVDESDLFQVYVIVPKQTCQNASDLLVFSVLYHCKLIIFGFFALAWT